MKVIPFLLKELEHEANTTRKFLNLVKPENFQWKPHERSMSIKQLCTHIAELPSWIDLAVNTDGIDFATNSYKPSNAENTQDLLNILENSLKKANEALLKVTEDDLLLTWTIRNGEEILQAMTKYEAIRHSFSQTTHHRAQLGVYLRILNIPIPGSYGPSADDPGMR
jgi:uncharacterized damage-inducible protein DinB